MAGGSSRVGPGAKEGNQLAGWGSRVEPVTGEWMEDGPDHRLA